MENQEDCIFCKIIKGKIPCYKVYEDEHSFAFLDINPINLGHTLIIPKKHYSSFLDASEEDLSRIMKTIKKIAPKILNALNTSSFNIIQSNGKAAGQEIFHVHFHLIPRYENDSKELAWKTEKILPEKMNEFLKKVKFD